MLSVFLSGRFYAVVYGMKIKKTQADENVLEALMGYCEQVH